jgi:hypothetical protein
LQRSAITSSGLEMLRLGSGKPILLHGNRDLKH